MMRLQQHDPSPVPKAQTHLARPQAQAFLKHHSQKARQEEGQGEMTVSYMPLMQVQQKPHRPTVVDRHFSSSLDILAAGRAARERLMGMNVTEQPKATPEQSAEPVADTTAPDISDVPQLPEGMPLDLLLPCSWKFLLALAAVRHGVTPADIVSSSRQREITAARQEAMALIYQHTTASTTGVGRYLQRDHTTVVYSLHKLRIDRKLIDVPLAAEAMHRPKKGPARDARRRRVEDAVRKGYEEGIPCAEIADRAGVSKSYVRSKAYELGLKHPAYRVPQPSPLLKIMSSEQLERYRHLTKNQRFTAAEARKILGVAP